MTVSLLGQSQKGPRCSFNTETQIKNFHIRLNYYFRFKKQHILHIMPMLVLLLLTTYNQTGLKNVGKTTNEEK